jgi:hypothetical protein
MLIYAVFFHRRKIAILLVGCRKCDSAYTFLVKSQNRATDIFISHSLCYMTCDCQRIEAVLLVACRALLKYNAALTVFSTC